jgi:hypothetical protein
VTQGVATTNAARGTNQPAGAPPPKNKATQVAVATQIASGTPFPTATSGPGATQIPGPTSNPTPTKIPQPTKTPAPTKVPTATPIPGNLAFNRSGATSTGTSLPHINSGVISGCNDFSSASTTLFNTGKGSLSWSSSYTVQSGSNQDPSSDGTSWFPNSGTLAPGASVNITFNGGFLWSGDSIIVTYFGPNDVTEFISC